MRGRARLAIGAVALIAGVAVFWLSISIWTRDRIHAADGLDTACLREGDMERFLREPARFRGYLAGVVARHAGVAAHPPTPAGRIGEILIERFGFLFVPEEDHVHLIEAMRICGAAPVSS